MKKTTIILLLVIQIVLLFIFQNIQTVFKEIEEIDITKIRNPYKFTEDIKRIRKIFSALAIAMGLLVIGTGFYLVILYKKSRTKPEHDAIPPLQDYLLELKGSETQLKHLVEEQRVHVTEKEELNKSIIDNINSAVIFINQGGRIDIFNTVAEQLFSQSFANARNSFPAKILSGFPEIVEFVQTHKGEKISREIAANEGIFFVDLNPLENIGQLLLIKDITEEKKREEIERRNANFVMLGEMAAFLAHEIKNSLGVIYGYTKTIKGDREKTGKVNKEVNFLTAMMESFLNFSRPVRVDIEETIDLVDLFKRIAAERDIEIELDSDRGEADLSIKSDPALIRPVFSNLLLNSREAGADRVTVTFKTFKKDKTKNLEIILQDNGRGIDDRIREKIWYPFFTTKEKGTGMGLAIIRKIITTLNGEISLEGTGPGGTTFKIIFYK
jgi:signal transduction histidine kinase